MDTGLDLWLIQPGMDVDGQGMADLSLLPHRLGSLGDWFFVLLTYGGGYLAN